MIDYLYGILNLKASDGIIIEVNNIGYAISVPFSTFSKLPEIGNPVKIYIVEAVAGMYGGIIYLYGFLTREERDMYLLIKDEVPGTGAKKAMEYTDKISKSFADFKVAVISKNSSMLNGIFGFTKKTADKLIAALKDKISKVNVSGEEKWSDIDIKISKNTVIAEAIEALIALGYKEQQAITAVTSSYDINNNITLENLIKKSLQYL
ncbi:MAG: Holliday junction branch migration protein RuvA [Endomicrobium sp.]|jgi:Holliday junction DNA helicase RuvA|nr:Holliday junction branch migration protein RuvA [Endomicrobium sp.]